MWIADFDFNANKEGKNFGLDNFKKLTKFCKDKSKDIIGIIGGGDYAYDLETNNGERGLEFLKEAEVLFSSLPFLPVAGNHETNLPTRNFKYFNSYFRTPHY